MANLVNKIIVLDGRNWKVVGFNEILEVLHVQEVGRNFKMVVSFDEVA